VAAAAGLGAARLAAGTGPLLSALAALAIFGTVYFAGTMALGTPTLIACGRSCADCPTTEGASRQARRVSLEGRCGRDSLRREGQEPALPGPELFRPGGGVHPERAALVRQIADLETIVVASEAQALLLENNLIKEHQPRFNIRLRDDKSYPRIAVTLAEPFPRVLVTRRLTLRARATSALHRRRHAAPDAEDHSPHLHGAFVHWDLPREAPDRPCLDYHIDRCRRPASATRPRPTTAA